LIMVIMREISSCVGGADSLPDSAAVRDVRKVWSCAGKTYTKEHIAHRL
jgi:hypothetical protein